MKNADVLDAITGLVFSSAFLLAFGVIASGIFLGKSFPFRINGKHIFVVNLKIIRVEAKGHEVILGFVGFILMTGIVGVAFGGNAKLFLDSKFFLDQSFFISICIVSSFLNLFLSILIYLFSIVGGFRDKEREPRLDRRLYNSRIRELSRE